MMKFKNQIITQRRVDLDGNEFYNCTFSDCEVVYTGQGKLVLVNSDFGDNINWFFIGPAGSTLQFLGVLYHASGPGGRVIVEDIFENIRSGAIAASPPP